MEFILKVERMVKAWFIHCISLFLFYLATVNYFN
jgi:hypothetical protein